MKKFRVQVNGKEYEVEIEEMTRTAGAAVPSPAAAPKPAAPAAAPAPPPVPPASTAEGDEVIVAPMPGKIFSIVAKPGQAVKEGDLILVLEAMKMENEIFCGRAGTVKEICVTESANVNTGDTLAIIG